MEKQRMTVREVMRDKHWCSIFRKITCIGDSLASGELESLDKNGKRGYHDYYEYSWGQFIARELGARVINASRGGMTAKEFIESYGDWMGAFGTDNASQAYIIALGVNDAGAAYETGTVADICDEDYTENKPTFAGYYGAIVQRIRLVQPKAKIFFVTQPFEPELNSKRAERTVEQRAFIFELAKKFEHTFVLDLYERAPVYDAEFRKKYFCGGHMNASGYLFTAGLFIELMDEIIESDPEEFSQVGFIGKGGIHNCEQKW